MTKWLERYRRQAEERYRRLDALLARMDDDGGAERERTEADDTEPERGAAG